MDYGYKLVRALMRDHEGTKKIEYLFDVDGKRFRFRRRITIKTGYTRYSISGQEGNLILSWRDDVGFTYMDLSGDIFRILESILLDKFCVNMPILS